MSGAWKPGPLPAESETHNHSLLIGYCTQQCPAYTARPEGFPAEPHARIADTAEQEEA